MARILFSPVGNTDPITNNYDGAMLHIIREYRPDKVYLYLSKDIVNKEEKDHRYSYCINKIQEFLGIEMECEWIQKDDLEHVQLFDYFTAEFRKILDKICNEHTEKDEIYLNVSSGTPAMKSSLQNLASFYERKLIPIQVVAPENGKNTHENNLVNNYDPALQWEYNLDNEENHINRCKESPVTNFNVEIRKSIIKRHIEAYNYVAALEVAIRVREHISEQAIALIEAGAARLKLDKSTCDKKAKFAHYDIYPVKQGDHWNIFEYLMIMQIKIYKEEYADYMRALSPVFFKLMEKVIQASGVIDLNKLTYRQKDSNALKWVSNEANKDETIIGSGLYFEKDRFVTTGDYTEIIKSLDYGIVDMNIINTIYEIRRVECNIRNTAAHNIACITDGYISTNTGYTSDQIFSKLCKLASHVGIKIGKKELETYTNLNSAIKSWL